MSENLKFFKGLEKDLPTSDIQPGAIYHCTDTKNTYLGIDDETMELFSSGGIYRELWNGGYVGGLKSHPKNDAQSGNATALGSYTKIRGRGGLSWGSYSASFNNSNDNIISTVVGCGTSIMDRQNSFVLDKYGNGYYKGDLYVKGTTPTLHGSGQKVATEQSIDAALLHNITYQELLDLRDNGQLVPGRQYRIIDYQTTTTKPWMKSAMHQFDIIVTADDEHTLNENARAIHAYDYETGILRFDKGDEYKKYFTLDYPTDLIWHNKQSHYMYEVYKSDELYLEQNQYTCYTIPSSYYRDQTFVISGVNLTTDIELSICLYDGTKYYNYETMFPESGDFNYRFTIPANSNEQRVVISASIPTVTNEDNLYFTIYQIDANTPLVRFDITTDEENPTLLFGTEFFVSDARAEEAYAASIFQDGQVICSLPAGDYILWNECIIDDHEAWPEDVYISCGDYFSESNLSAWQLKYTLDGEPILTSGVQPDDIVEFIWRTDDITQDTCVSFNIVDASDDTPQQTLYAMENNTPTQDYVDLFAADEFYDGMVFCQFTVSQLKDKDICIYAKIFDDAEWPRGSYVEVRCNNVVLNTFRMESYHNTSGTHSQLLLAFDSMNQNLCKGTIYYMKDEFGNECPYDFKNIQFLRRSITSVENDIDQWMLSTNTRINYQVTKSDETSPDHTDTYYYTFSFLPTNNSIVQDFSVIKVIDRENQISPCNNNIITGDNNVLIIDHESYGDPSGCQYNYIINSNDNTITSTTECSNSYLYYSSYNMIQGSQNRLLCYNDSNRIYGQSNTLYEYCDNNSIVGNYNTLESQCDHNSLNECANCILGMFCSANNLTQEGGYQEIIYEPFVTNTTLTGVSEGFSRRVIVKTGITYKELIVPDDTDEWLIFKNKEEAIIYV